MNCRWGGRHLGWLAGASSERLQRPAAAVELIHAYSLVHDDLPCMDDDDLRRGRPTCHKAFDEATALLVGDALQTLAFEVLLTDQDNPLSPLQRARMGAALARASGSVGMAGGQAIDLQAVGQSLDAGSLETMHRLKTGALIRASVALGALAAESIDEALLARLDEYAACVGLAFQIRDDILDVEGTAESLGKASGADQALNKPTFPSIHGLGTAKQMANDYRLRAMACLDGLDAALSRPLLSLADFAVRRNS